MAEFALFLQRPCLHAAFLHGVLVTAGTAVVKRLFQLDGVALLLFRVMTFTASLYLTFAFKSMMTGLAVGKTEVGVVLMTESYNPGLGVELYDLPTARNGWVACTGNTPRHHT